MPNADADGAAPNAGAPPSAEVEPNAGAPPSADGAPKAGAVEPATSARRGVRGFSSRRAQVAQPILETHRKQKQPALPRKVKLQAPPPQRAKQQAPPLRRAKMQAPPPPRRAKVQASPPQRAKQQAPPRKARLACRRVSAPTPLQTQARRHRAERVRQRLAWPTTHLQAQRKAPGTWGAIAHTRAQKV